MKPVTMPLPPSRSIPELTAWPTGVPGLVVTQIPAGQRCAGKWRVCHARSALSMPYCLPDPETALAFAQALMGAGTWQEPAAEVLRAMNAEPYKHSVARFGDLRCIHGRATDSLDHDNGVIA